MTSDRDTCEDCGTDLPPDALHRCPDCLETSE